MDTVQVFKRLNIPSEKERRDLPKLRWLLARIVDESPLVVEVTPTIFFLKILTVVIVLHGALIEVPVGLSINELHSLVVVHHQFMGVPCQKGNHAIFFAELQ
jgi:hypothetical protein